MMRNVPGGEIHCFPDSEWLEMAGGLLGASQASAMMEHAASCSVCAERLAGAVRLLHGEASGAEEQMLAGLKTSTPEWQRNAGVKLAAIGSPRRRPSTRAWWLAAAAVLVSICGGIVAKTVVARQRPPFDLIAAAYTRHRTVELRLKGAEYSELRIERGSSGPSPAELLESEARIQKHLESRPDDPEWLLAKGRAALLEHRFEEAREALELARDLNASKEPRLRAEILADLATAYFERAEAPGRAIDYSMAIEDLGQALQIDPQFAMAYFNRALVFEKSAAYPEAISDWKRYLELDRSGPWADEARRHLAKLEEKMKAAEPQSGHLADLAELNMDRLMGAKLDGSDAVALQEELSRKHNDRWLKEALPARSLPAVTALAGMAVSRGALRMDRFTEELAQLTLLEHSPLPPPVKVWAAFERLFRVTHSPKVRECIPGLESFIEISRRRSYAWFLAQFLLERSTCEMARGDFLASEATGREAMEISGGHDYPVARLRAAGFLAGRFANAGQYREAAQLTQDSLQFFWSRPLPFLRAQEFFNSQVWMDEGLGRYHAAMSAAAAAAELARLSGIDINEAINRARRASLAAKLGMTEEALTEYSASRAIFDRMGASAPVEEYRAFADSFFSPAATSSELSHYAQVVDRSTNPLVVVAYRHALARAAEQRGALREAEKYLRDTIEVLTQSEYRPRDAQRLLEWRFQLQESYRDLVWTMLTSGDAPTAYNQWQDFLRADFKLQGLRPQPHGPRTDGDGATLVTFVLLRSRYGAWVRTSGNLKFAWLGRAESIDRRTRAFAALCSKPDATLSLVHGLAESLGADLFGQIGAAIPGSGVLLVQPDGELKRMPWAALVLNGKLARERYTFAIVPGPVAPDATLVVPSLRIRRALMVAATMIEPSLRANFPALPSLAGEIAAVRGTWPDSVMLEGNVATAAEIERSLPSVDAIHYAGHAMVTPNQTLFLVAPDPRASDTGSRAGLWDPLRNRAIVPQLAVLSACSTGRSADAEDPSPESVASGLLLGGASQVLATLWNVDSDATSRWMQSFYASLRRNPHALDAFHEAAAGVWRHPGEENPYYWASFLFYVRL